MRKNRKANGSFVKQCGYEHHLDNKSQLVRIFSERKVSKVLLEKLYQDGALSRKASYICKLCLEKVKNESLNEPSDSNFDQKAFECQEKGISSNTIPTEKSVQTEYDRKEKGVQADFHTEKEDSEKEIHDLDDLDEVIKNDIKQLYKENSVKDINTLIHYDPKEWLKNRPKDLVNYLFKMTKLRETEDFSNLVVANIIEQIYGCRNRKLVLPFSFRHNLLTYSLSNSKLLLNANATLLPSGGYNFVRSWQEKQAENEIEFPGGLVKVVFDNEQVVGKQYRVNVDASNAPVSVVTSFAYIVIDTKSSLQNEERFQLDKWYFKGPSLEQQIDIKEIFAFKRDFFRETRNAMISHRLVNLIKEYKENTMTIETLASTLVDCENAKFCCECGGANDGSFRCCRNCGGKLEKKAFLPENVDVFQYDPFNEIFKLVPNENSFQVVVGEPEMLNPSGFANISEIVENLGKKSRIAKYCDTSQRKWLLLENDGGIYHIVLKLINNVYVCTACQDKIYGLVNFKEHSCYVLNMVRPQHYFNWLIMSAGLLHIEMNCAKAFMNINWDVFLKDIVIKLGFKTEKALEYIKKCSDHHKAWSILESTYYALVDELLAPYVKNCIVQKEQPTMKGYWKFSEEATNATYIYVQDMVFTYLHSMMLLRQGIRNNNSSTILCAKFRLTLLFFGGTHSIYREIMYNEILQYVLMPEELKSLLCHSMTCSRNQSVGHYQSGDAILEEINKNAKKWNIGVPSKDQWIKNFRNLDAMSKIRESALRGLNISDGSCGSTEFTASTKEIVMIRSLLRAKGYLENPFSKSERVESLCNRHCLSMKLKSFTEVAKQNFVNFVDAKIMDKPYHHERLEIFHESEEALSNLTKEEIKRKIFQELSKYVVSQRKLQEEFFQKEVRNKAKADYIDYFFSIKK